MTVVDASVWVSAFMAEDVHHSASLEWLRQYLGVGGQLSAPFLLLPEVAGALRRRTGQLAAAARGVDRLLHLPRMHWVALDGRLSMLATRIALDLQLRGADAIYVAVADQLGVPLVSWDGEHLTRATLRIPVYSPETVP